MKKLTLIAAICVVAFLFCSCSAMFARPTRLSRSQTSNRNPPDKGLRVTRVYADSPAQGAGIQNMDVITRYGEFKIVDDASFFAAKNHYEAAKVPTVEIEVWRGIFSMTAKVRPGWLGVDSTDNDKVSQEFMKQITRLNTLHELPEYMMDREFKGQFEEGPAKILENAKAIVDKAETEGTLTPEQIQLYRIYLVLDDAPIVDQQRQAVLLQELIATQPFNYIHMLGSDKFFELKRYRPAVACFKEYLKRESNDVSIRLNLGFAYNQLGMYHEAQQAADYVFEHRLGLSKHGQNVAYIVKAKSALGLKDYATTIRFAERAFEIEHSFYPIALIHLAAAQTGDLRTLEETKKRFEVEDSEDYAKMKLQVDAVKAYALAKANQGDDARKLVRSWKDLDRNTGKVIDYWRVVPGGDAVTQNWQEMQTP